MRTGCLTLAVAVDGSDVRTVEGLASPDGELAPLQRAFIDYGGFQCGICTPGQLMAATALLDENPRPTATEIREWMEGNLCRCTGYTQIVESILAASGGDVASARPAPLQVGAPAVDAAEA
jgi:carbon-monoxide dehydrogenase small subunit